MTVVSLIDQIWENIDEFPDYDVSNWGLIFNKRRGTVMRSTRTNHGHVKISLCNWEGRFTRSVAVLVAEAFVIPPDTLCNSVVLLDGVLTNVMADNLVWRPPWFSWLYVRQLKEPQPVHYCNLEVTNIDTDVYYPNIMEAGMKEGLLFIDIWRSTYTGNRVYPTNDRFQITERV